MVDTISSVLDRDSMAAELDGAAGDGTISEVGAMLRCSDGGAASGSLAAAGGGETGAGVATA